MKKFLILLCAATIMTMACACGGSDSNELVMATNAEFPPYEYHEGGEIVGIDVEIAQAIAREMGRTLVIEDMAFDSIIMSVQSGKADIGVAGLTIEPDRLAAVNFSVPYTTAAQVIIVKEGSDIKTPDDLKGLRVGVQLGTTGDMYAADIEGATVERYNKGFEAVQALLQDKVDAVMIDSQPAKVFVEQNEGITLVDEAFTYEEYAIAVSKDNEELLNEINEAINKMKESGELQAIIDKYIAAE